MNKTIVLLALVALVGGVVAATIPCGRLLASCQTSPCVAAQETVGYPSTCRYGLMAGYCDSGDTIETEGTCNATGGGRISMEVSMYRYNTYTYECESYKTSSGWTTNCAYDGTCE